MNKNHRVFLNNKNLYILELGFFCKPPLSIVNICLISNKKNKKISKLNLKNRLLIMSILNPEEKKKGFLKSF